MSDDTVKTPYPGYDVLSKWASPSYNTLTRGVLARRMHGIPERRFFDEGEFRTLEAVCARLLPQPDRAEPVAIAPWIDAQVFENRGEGFRHPDMPPEPQAWRQGLAGIEAQARRRYAQAFADMHPDSQDATLAAIHAGEADPADFGAMSPDRFFVHILLKSAAAIYYSHPAAWSEIGFGGPASPRGYVRLDGDRRDAWEAAGATAGHETLARIENRHVV